ncbi:MAG: nucleotidyl transferase AbiEii/AbiGii toxin family protein [Acidobacteria bacterium]|nr:nucleotidyl transferase AbiEii/AbiGii toxin family protein [Acidobacteriota bacterium]
MPDNSFWSQPATSRHLALTAAQAESGRKAHFLEKDIWIVEILRILFDAPFATDLVFKGGTSLSKAWGAIERFSEDVDITYDIRAIAPDLVGNSGPEALPPTRSQEQRWTKAIRARLSSWVRDEAAPALAEGLRRAGLVVQPRVAGDRIHVDYDPLFGGYGPVLPNVIVEFGARSTGEPYEVRRVRCDAASLLPGIVFPEARPAVMLAERTFWEKATAMHVFCKRDRGRGDRLTRHWYDLVRLDRTGFAEKALADHSLAESVARHKAIFFREKDTAGSWISYQDAVTGALQLVPSGSGRETLAADHQSMIRSGMLPEDAEPFDELMDACADLERRANAR